MEDFRTISPGEMEDNVFKTIGSDWMLVTAGSRESFNTMTAAWGGMGFLWNKNVCFIFIRPQRYTYSFIEKAETFTLSFFDEEYRKIRQRC
jgi:flavin reductase (DIM6/NTAB) family NADH-FMN oxidoreductase RutF